MRLVGPRFADIFDSGLLDESISDFTVHMCSLLNLVAFQAYMLFTQIC